MGGSKGKRVDYEVGPYWRYMHDAEAGVFEHIYKQCGSWAQVAAVCGMTRQWVYQRLTHLSLFGIDLRERCKTWTVERPVNQDGAAGGEGGDGDNQTTS